MPSSPRDHHATQIELWFREHQRSLPWRRDYLPWHIWVSEVMLQQTRMSVVLPYFERFIARFPSVASAAEASEQDVLTLWSGLGYYRRASMLHRGAVAVMEDFGGTIPSSVSELRRIPGIGRYTAGAIASIAFGRPEPIVDGNVSRILSRLIGVEHPAGSSQLMRHSWQHAAALIEAASDPRAMNQGLMELGALICTPRNPSCGECPLASSCVARVTGRTAELPWPKERAMTVRLEIPLYIVTDGEGRVLMRREQGRLMRAMYHLPHGDASLLPGVAFRATPRSTLGSFRHSVTTRRIHFTVHEASPCSVGDRNHGYQNSDYEWVAPATLAEIPHPSYVRKALALWLAR